MEETNSIQIISGDDRSLYSLLGPLVMDAKVLKYNNNYPFKTSPHHVWYIFRTMTRKVEGFVPLRMDANRWLVDNYYVKDDNEEVFLSLLNALPEDHDIEAMVQSRHRDIFLRAHFQVVSQRVNYLKMVRTARAETNTETDEERKS